MPQPVLLALIGSSTANVVGLFVIVARYLFPGLAKHDQTGPTQASN